MRQMLYPAPGIRVPSPPPAPLREISGVEAGGEPVAVWAGPRREPDAARPAVLFFHGNGENLETMRRSGLFADLERLGIDYWAAEYPGYGRSGGKPSEASLVTAAEAAWERLGRDHPGQPRVLCGWSLGAAVAVQLAARRPAEVDRLLLLSAWAGLPELAAEHFPGWMVSLLLADRYESIAAAPRLGMPALIVHGDRDAIIPVEHGRRLAAALPAARWVEVAGAGHNDLLARPEVWREMAAFLTPAGPAAGEEESPP